MALALAAAESALAALEVVEHDTPGVLPASQGLEVHVVLRNLEPVSWGGDGDWAVSYHWLTAGGEVVAWDGARTPLPGAVAPLGTVAVSARLETPAAGDYLLVWDVVHEGVRWVGDRGPGPPRFPVAVRPSHAFSLDVGSTPRLLRAGSGSRHRVTVRNDGLRAWPGDGSVAVACHWLSPAGEMVEWEGARTPTTRQVPPGASIELEVTVVAPDAPGRYLLLWDMVEEGVCWFSQVDPTPTEPAAVWVYPPIPGVTLVWVGSLLLGSAAATVARRRGWTGSVPGVEVLWGLGTLVSGQAVVLAEIGLRMTPAGGALAAVGAALVLAPWVLLTSARRWWAVVGVVVAGLTVLHADRLYLRFFGDLLSLSAVRAIGQVDEVGASIAGLLSWGDLWVWAPIVAAPMVHRLRPLDGESFRVRRALAAALVGVIVVGVAAAAWTADRTRDAVEQVFRHAYLAREIGVLNAHAVDVAGTTMRALRRRSLDPDELERVVSWFEEQRPRRAATGRWAGAARGRNLILIQVESLQSFVLDMNAAGSPVTPLLRSWQREALWFSNVTDQTEQGRSSDAELTTQASLLPLTAGAAVFAHGDNHFSSLAGELAGAGYHTLSAVPFDGGFWNRQVTHGSFGYGERLFVEAFEAGESIGWGLNDRDFMDQMATRLGALPRPFAAWLITLSLHHPYEGFPAHLSSLDVGEHAGTPLGNYLHTMHYFDTALAGFVARLEASGLLEDSVLVVWGDHDAGFEWSRETAAALGARPDAVGWYLSQQVPLFVLAPGIEGLSGEWRLPAGHVDVAPTVLALLGIDPADTAFVGRNLLGDPGDGPVVGEYRCWRTSSRLFLQGGMRLDDGRCFELPSLAPLPSSACAEGFAAAAEQARVSETVLEFDLQTVVSERLDAVPGSG